MRKQLGVAPSGSTDETTKGYVDTAVATRLANSTVTTKGDILAASGSATIVRVAVGANNTILMADSSQTAGVRWASVTLLGKYTTTIGNGSAVSFTITHNLGSKDCVCSVRDVSDIEVECDKTYSTTNTMTLGFYAAPSTNAYRVTVIG